MEEHCPNMGALMVCVCVYTYSIFTKIPITDRKCVKILLRMYSNQGGFRSSQESKVLNYCSLTNDISNVYL